MAQSAVVQFTSRLEMEECCNCGIQFGIPASFRAEAIRKGPAKTFYCPNGHPQAYLESEADKLRKELEVKEAALVAERHSSEFWRTQNELTGRKLTAQRGANTKLRKRVGHGVCPCCQRTFKQLAAHMANKHPEYAKSGDEAQEGQATSS